MARRGQRFRAPPPGDPNDPNSWRVIVDMYLLSLELRALSPATVYGRRRSLVRFATWNIANQTLTPLTVDEHIVTDYQLHLHRHIGTTGHLLTPRTRQQYLIAVRGLYRWLRRTHRIETDPTIDIELPKTPDLRSIQTMLDHRNLASTQRYTHINIDHLTQIHTATHPAASIQPPTTPRPVTPIV